MSRWWKRVYDLPATLVIGSIRVYQYTLSPFIGRQCRFHPSCSNYMILAIRKYGVMIGVVKGTWRVCRCNPFCTGGIDYP